MISPFLVQAVFQFWRALRQYLRDVFGIAFDLALPMFTGVACGVLSLGKQWTPPLTELSDWAANATRCLGCGAPLDMIPLRVDAMCKMLQINNDPFPPMSLMACMGLGLTAVTSSLRLFSNKAVFKRESRAGMSTEAYYLGRMMLHMLVSVTATFLFTISFYWLVAPHSPFGLLFVVFFLVYLCCSGVGFWTSVLLVPSLSGLIAILGVLAFVLFGGSMFITGVALPPLDDGLNVAFWAISLLSPMRWSYELVVLIIMKVGVPQSEMCFDSVFLFCSRTRRICTIPLLPICTPCTASASTTTARALSLSACWLCCCAPFRTCCSCDRRRTDAAGGLLCASLDKPRIGWKLDELLNFDFLGLHVR